MNTSKIIRGVVSSGRYTVTAPIVKEDYGLYLKIEGVELPEAYEVDFSNDEKNGTSITMIGNADGVLIPSQFIDSGKDVFAFLYHVGANYGRTVYKFRIPNKVRPDRTDETPTPEQASVIDQAISALNEAVEQTAQDVESADASARMALGYAESAQASANNASASAQASANSATASSQSASQSAQIKADVEDLADDAQASANASAQSANASANSASQAQGFANNASASAQSASQSASGASASAQTASAKAQDASGYAQTASGKASESAQSASQALSYKTDAESAKTASQTAQGLAESARDSAISAKTDAELAKADAESARDEAVQAVASISGALDDKADIITDTASGSIASFPDGADNLPLKSLVVDIDPIQDLHGQDAPYPAGGGKNLLKNTLTGRTVNGLTITVDDFGRITVNGTATATTSLSINSDIGVSAGTYVISGITGGSTSTYKLEAKADGAWGKNVTTKPLTVTVTEGLTNLALVIYSDATLSNVVISPMICDVSASNPTVFAPYENICPISGWTEVNVNHSDADMTNPTTITIDLGQTVYGGHLDVLSGVLTVYPYYASYNGETLTGEWISDRDVYVAGTTPTIGAQVVNIGAQGVTVQLEPHEVESLHGVNNIWADSGDVSAEYRANTKLYISKKIAEAISALS